SQLQKHYVLDAELMFSQPCTKIFLRTSEPDSAKWISETIGEVEIEQMRESRTREQSPHYRHSRNDQLERRIEPLVLPSQIMGLEDRRGYVKFGNAVVQLSFPYVKVPKTQPEAGQAGREVGIARRGSRGPLPQAQRRPTPDHWRTANPPPSSQRIHEQARRPGKPDGTPRRMGRDVFGAQERIAYGPCRRR